MRIYNGLPMLALALIVSPTVMSCAGPTGPSGTATVDQFVQTLQDRGLTVRREGTIVPNDNRFFTVGAQQLVIDGSRVSAFEYPSVKAAASEAALVTPDGQPNPVARFSWVSTPRFYRQERIIVLYVGCSADLIRTLDDVLAAPFVIGATQCPN